MLRPIYEPRTRAREYCDLAVNIYTGCPHGCTYCYARAMAKRFAGNKYIFRFDTPEPRSGIVEAVKRQLADMQGQSKRIMLCFTCDPYPIGFNSTATREVIRAIKASGNHVQILTKGDETAQRDFDLLDGNDSFGVTLTGAPIDEWEPNAARTRSRIINLKAAKSAGLNTWVSCEPVLCVNHIRQFIATLDFVDLWRIGKLNHRKSDIDWRQFGHDIEALCKLLGRNYYIKEDLRKAMEMP